ncbi:MAG: type II secretion system secretin GspD [Lysobacteraceae bacterium]
MSHPRTARPALLLAALLALSVPAPLPAQDGGEGRHTLNLSGADIGVLIQTVSEITGRNFIVDPAVEGRVTVISAQPQGAEEVWATFESVLKVHGYAVVPAGSMWRVLPEGAAVRDGGAGVAASAMRPDALVTRVIEIGQVPAGELAQLLRPLVSASAQVAAQGNTLVVTDRAANVDRIERLVRRIDTASDNEVEVIPLRHANAAEMARTLSQLDPQVQGLAAANAGRLLADARTNSILISGDRGARLRLRTLVAHLDTPLSDGDATQVVYLRYADGAALLPVLESVANTLTGAAANGEGPRAASIQHHAETNALVITAAPAVYRELAAVVRSLDVRRAQVLVEAVIAEVSDELADELGVQWQATDVREDGMGGLTRGWIGGSNLPGSGQGIVGFNPTQGVGPGLNLGYLDRVLRLGGEDGEPVFQLGLLVKALRGDGRANVLSQPSVVTLDHHEAEFKVAQEVPFITGSFTSVGGGGAQPQNPFQTIERRDVGLILRVTPHVNEGDSVRLEIFQEVSNLSPNQLSQAADLITNTRQIRTSVLVPDGGLLVLGGLSSEDISEQIQGVPGLSRIPGVGALFRNRQTSRSNRTLMIFMRPIILRDGITEAAVSSEKYNFLRSEQLQMRQRYEGRIRGGDLPALPEDPADLFRTPPPLQPAQPEPRGD